MKISDHLSKNEKKLMKQFQLNDKNDFICYLQELIARTDKCIVKKKKYLERLSKYIDQTQSLEKHTKQKPEEIIVIYEKYSEFIDLLSSGTSYVLNLIGDHQAASLSYKKFRDQISRRQKKGTIGFTIRDIDERVIFLLDDLNKMRNWYNHVPESLLLSEIKLIKEGEFGAHKQNPIEINYHQYCTLEVVQDLLKTEQDFYNVIREVHQSMKKDYSSIIGKSVSIERIIIDKPKGIDYFKPTKLSCEVQGIKGKLENK